MKTYPRTITEEERNRLEDEYDRIEQILIEEIEVFLSRIEVKPIRNHVHETAFLSNSALPKRPNRLHTTAPLLAQTVYTALADDDGYCRDLLRFVVAVQEYYDIFDDLLDDDVSESRWEEVFVAHEILFPMLSDEISQLGAEAAAYWSHRAVGMMSGPYTEVVAEPASELYLEIVDQQSLLYGFATGLAAVCAEATEEQIAEAERLGCLFFKLHQLSLDFIQYPSDDDPWNAWKLFPAPDITDRFSEYREEAVNVVDTYPEESAEILRTLAAIDIESMKSDATL